MSEFTAHQHTSKNPIKKPVRSVFFKQLLPTTSSRLNCSRPNHSSFYSKAQQPVQQPNHSPRLLPLFYRRHLLPLFHHNVDNPLDNMPQGFKSKPMKSAFTSRKNHTNVKSFNKIKKQNRNLANTLATKRINRGIEQIMAQAASVPHSGVRQSLVKPEKNFVPTSIKGKKIKSLSCSGLIKNSGGKKK